MSSKTVLFYFLFILRNEKLNC